MSESTVARFPQASLPHRKDNDPHGAEHARKRIAELPDPYLAHATPRKESLVGAVDPVSPAAEAAQAAKSEHTVPTAPERAVTAASAENTPAAPTTLAEAGGARVVTEAGSTPLQSPLVGTEAPSEVMDTANLPGSAIPTPPQSLPGRLRPLLVGVLTFIGLFLVFKAPIFLSQLNYLTQPRAVTTSATQAAAAAVPAAPTISIPKINVNAPVVYATDNNENNILTDLESGVVHYANTAVPGQPGNSVIFGHSSNDWWETGNYKFVFVLLDKLQVGDSYTVNYNSHQYIYQVTGSQVVDPTDLSVLNQTATPTMTLITCTPPGTSWKRLVVTAKQISPAPSTTTPAPTTNTASAAKSSGGSLPGNSQSLTGQISSWWHGVTNWVTGKKAAPAPAKSAAPSTPSGTLPAT